MDTERVGVCEKRGRIVKGVWCLFVCVSRGVSFIFITDKSFSNILWPVIIPFLPPSFPLSACSWFNPPPNLHHPPPMGVAMETGLLCQVAPRWVLPSALICSDIVWLNHSATWSRISESGSWICIQSLSLSCPPGTPASPHPTFLSPHLGKMVGREGWI